MHTNTKDLWAMGNSPYGIASQSNSTIKEELNYMLEGLQHGFNINTQVFVNLCLVKIYYQMTKMGMYCKKSRTRRYAKVELVVLFLFLHDIAYIFLQ